MKVGILSASNKNAYVNARLRYEIEQQGHEAHCIDYTQSIAAITEEGRQLLTVNSSGEISPIEVDTVISRVGKLSVSAALALAIFEANNVPTTANLDAIQLARNKVLSQIAFDKAGIPTPYTIAPTGRMPKKFKGLLDILEKDKKRPIVIKTTQGSLGKGVIIAESRRSAISQIQGFDSQSVPYLLQEFIAPREEDISHSDIRLFVVDGSVVASMKRSATSEDEFRANISLGGSAIEYEPTQREVEIALRAYDVIGAKVAGVDLMDSTRGTLLTEVNSNPGFSIERYTGVNVVKAIVECAVKSVIE